MLAVDFKRWSAFTMTWGWALTWTVNRASAWVLPFVLSSELLVPVARADEATRAQDSGKEKEAPQKPESEKKEAAKKEEPKKDEPKKDGEKKDDTKEGKKADAGEKQKEEVLKILKAAKKAEGKEEAGKADASPAAAIASPEATKEKAAKEKKAGQPKKKEPDTPMFRLRDGTFLAGVPDLKMFHVKTAYGGLVVPVNEVVRVRFASLKDEKVGRKIQENIQ